MPPYRIIRTGEMARYKVKIPMVILVVLRAKVGLQSHSMVMNAQRNAFNMKSDWTQKETNKTGTAQTFKNMNQTRRSFFVLLLFFEPRFIRSSRNAINMSPPKAEANRAEGTRKRKGTT
jgi:hypothetical protein